MVMAKLKAPVYKEKDKIICEELLSQLLTAYENLKISCHACVPIKQGSLNYGYGVSGSKKSICCDAVISIVKEIKKIKGW